MDTSVIITGVILILIGLGVIGIGIAFVVDIVKGSGGPGTEGAGVESPPRQRWRQTYTFLRIQNKTLAWIVTIITFLVGLGLVGWGIGVFATG